MADWSKVRPSIGVSAWVSASLASATAIRSRSRSIATNPAFRLQDQGCVGDVLAGGTKMDAIGGGGALRDLGPQKRDQGNCQCPGMRGIVGKRIDIDL